MQVFFKFLFLQCFWYLVVAQKLNLNFSFTLMVLMLTWHYFSLIHKFQFKSYIIHILIFLVTGLLFDGGLIFFGLINEKSYHLDLLLLWPAFYIYYDLGLLRFEAYKKHSQFFIGATGGLFSYFMGVRMEGFELINPILFYFYVCIFWGGFFIVSLSLVKKSIYKS